MMDFIKLIYGAHMLERASYTKVSYDRYVTLYQGTQEDLDALTQLAEESKWTSRYYKDARFPKQQLPSFYSEWVSKSVSGDLDDLVFCCEINGRLAGFISVKKLGYNFGSIGLIAVSPDFQGQGIGKVLVSHAVNFLFESRNCAAVQVVTQKDNLSACKMYESVGFVVSDDSKWLHKWIH